MTLSLVVAAMLAGTQPATAPTEAQPDQTKVVCKSVMVTGSRLSRRKICMSQKQWAEESEEINRSVSGGMGRSNKIPTN